MTTVLAWILSWLLIFVVALWLRGAWWRNRALVALSLSRTAIQGAAYPDLGILCLDGAFNYADVHARDILEQLGRYGEVITVPYSKSRVNPDLIVGYTAMSVCDYRRLVLVGGSMGSILATRVALMLRKAGYQGQISIIGADAALDASTLPGVQATLAPHAHLVHFGPVWNFLLSWVPRAMFRPLPEEDVELNVDRDLWQRHVAAMRATRMSAIIDSIALIGQGLRYISVSDREYLQAIPTAYIKSGRDGVLVASKAEQVWKQTFGSDTPVFDVPSGQHLTYVEHPLEWRQAFTLALKSLGYQLS